MLHARHDLVARAIMERTAAEVDIFMVMVNGREFVLLMDTTGYYAAVLDFVRMMSHPNPRLRENK